MPDCHTDTSRLFCYPPSVPLPGEGSHVARPGFPRRVASATSVWTPRSPIAGGGGGDGDRAEDRVFQNIEERSLFKSIRGERDRAEDQVFQNIEERSLFKSIRRGAVTIAGGALIGVGIPLIPTPVPGALFIGGGLSLLSTEYPEAQQLMDKGVDLLNEYAKETSLSEDDTSDVGLNTASMDSVVELNTLCGVIVPSQKEVNWALDRTVDNVAGAGRKVNRTIKSFVKGAISPAVKVMAHQKARAAAREEAAARANDDNTF